MGFFNKSAGVYTNEIDKTGVADAVPNGVPAGVIGTSQTGPAFVPIKVANFNNFIRRFGNVENHMFGPLAVKQWFANGANAGTFIRVLGIGDSKRRTITGQNTGKVNRAGFVVGSAQVRDTGEVGRNAHAWDPNNGGQAANRTVLGRMHFLGCFMAEANSSTYLREAGIVRNLTTPLTASKPILRGVLLAPSGVVLSLSGTHTVTNEPLNNTINSVATVNRFTGADFAPQVGGTAATDPAGTQAGDVAKANNADDTFILLINGLKTSAAYKNVITASFNPLKNGSSNSTYFANVFNTDPTKIQEAGHYLYTHYDVNPKFATVTNQKSNLSGSDGTLQADGIHYTAVANPDADTPFGRLLTIGTQAAFLMTASLGHNSGSATTVGSTLGTPNFEGFEERYQNAFSPFFISQDFGEGPVNLFKVHALSSGESSGPNEFIPTLDPKNIPANRLKISIRDIKANTSTKPGAKYGTFTLLVRDLHDSDKDPVIYETYTNLDLDPSSENYIARRIGDMNAYYEFDTDEASQKLVVEGRYPNASALIRVEMNDDVDLGEVGIDSTALPIGFRGHHHLVTSGTNIFPYVSGASRPNDVGGRFPHEGIVQPPVPFRRSIAVIQGPTTIKETSFYWGVQNTIQGSPTQPNQSEVHNKSVDSYTKYFPSYHTVYQNSWVGDNAGVADTGGSILDSDRFNNNIFTLERVQVVENSADALPDATEWPAARYRRNAVLSDLTKADGTTATGRFLDPTKDFKVTDVQQYLKFSTFLQGGFNGLNVFNQDKRRMTDDSVRREFDDISGQGGVSEGPTIKAYRKAVDILAEKSSADIQLLAIPGLRHTSITTYASDEIEERFDAMYIMDIEQKDANNTFITGSLEDAVTDITTTVSRFSDRNMDTSFAAAYYPDLILNESSLNEDITIPPTVAVLGAFALNDSVGFPWFAPAGFTRGVLGNVSEMKQEFYQADADKLYENDVNPIFVSPDSGGPVVQGQKTLLKAQSALDRVNVRRLLIEVRRRVRGVANAILFEPNRASTLARFSAAVNPILNQIQALQGIDRFKVQIDTTTTTQADVENNTIRGKIFLQPTRSVEFVSLDFVVTNTMDDDAL